ADRWGAPRRALPCACRTRNGRNRRSLLLGPYSQSMRIAVLVKQVPKFEEMELGPDGRLVRDGIELEMNPYCRRAVAQAVELASAHEGAQVTVLTLGPPSAEDTLREALAWGLARDI